ncbi:hypothetical protein GPECTOR_23g125 [Gonium pectorale]|uniref:ATP-dependent RNA helicase SUV3 C-terminal domain-containing protein n=1 Tax=Gonium pectorale TaxID=33097 RepID=A0A150GGS5_GONPE|nr:hypothetical protein GPECTOR_23g125 [Gonium pectorale]|eukprot:KXZ49038.1 hypothetical protein GPECTOR_23g125 [Gonium pectorale]
MLRLARDYCEEGRVGHDAVAGWESEEEPSAEAPRNEAELKRLEELHRCHDLYVWLSFRLPQAFGYRRKAEAARALRGALLEKGLERLAAASAEAFGRRRHRRPRAHGAAGQGGWEGLRPDWRDEGEEEAERE